MEKHSFKDLNLSENILKALENLGFNEPSQVQKEVIPYILNHQDVIVKSQTGSGKTASFGIPICEKIEVENSNVQCLILVPTRELALQVKNDISNIGRLKKIRCAAIFGKQPFNDQIRELKQRVHIVIGTPGRIVDHLERGTLKINKLNYIVIDEGDKMLNMGFVDQIKDILKILPKNKVTTLFSATLPDKIVTLSDEYMKNAKILNIKSKVFNRDRIKESYFNVEENEKFKLLCQNIYSEIPEKCIVFCNTRNKVKSIYNLMKKEGFLVAEIHGEMQQNERLNVMERFKNNEFKILVATDVASRGIHIDNITHVFNYEIPMEKESYVHRIGRTGRYSNYGKAISFVSDYEKKFLKEIEEYIGYEIVKGSLPEIEKIKSGKILFKDNEKQFINNKKKKEKVIHSEVTKIYLSGGKKKKIRNIDILGALSHINGLTGDDIGIIDVQDGFSFVDILNNKGPLLLKNNKEITVKGKKLKIQRAQK